MRLFLDANMITYIAVFEAFMIEGSPEELEAGLVRWERLQGDALGAALVDEIAALRVLYRIDDHAHFDWICSDVGIAEIERI